MSSLPTRTIGSAIRSAASWSTNDDGSTHVWGRGAVDMLNLTASMAVATKQLAQSGFRPKGTLVYLAVADEEALGTYGADHLVAHERDAVAADYVITESGGIPIPSPDGPEAAGHRGREGHRVVPAAGQGHRRPRLAAVPHRQRAGDGGGGRAPPRRVPSADGAARRVAPVHRVDGLPRRADRAAAAGGRLRRGVRVVAARHGPPVPRVHAHDDGADDRARRHQDQRHPRHRRPRARHQDVAGPDHRRGVPPARRSASAISAAASTSCMRTTIHRPRHRSRHRCGMRSAG